MAEGGRAFRPGDRIVIHGGNDGERSAWLQGGAGYEGTIRKLTAQMAAVELDDELALPAPEGSRWADFGTGSAKKLGDVAVARGRWLTLIHAWVGQTWQHAQPLHVAVCSTEPDLEAIPQGGGIGCWVESHASIRLGG